MADQARTDPDPHPGSAPDPEEPPSLGLVPGHTLGSYTIIEEIGSGGMGVVYKAWDASLERHVALKALTPERAGSSEDAARFEKECRILAQLTHPNIVAVHEARTAGGIRYLVMDFVEGRTASAVLSDLADRKATPTAAALDAAIGRQPGEDSEALLEGGSYYRSVARIVRAVVRAVRAAHARGILHRDLKPANIMLTSGGRPVVLDFGLAGWSAGPQGTVTQGFYGTPSYLAPEQVRDSRAGADPRTDIYQLGLVLYEFLTLSRAVEGGSVSEVFERILRGEYPWPRHLDPGVPRDLEAICLRALEPDPSRRYAEAAGLEQDLSAFLEGGPVLARPRSPLRRAGVLLRKHRLSAMAACALLVGLAAGALFLVDRGKAVGLRAFRVGKGESEPRYLAPLEAVTGGDLLGVEVECDQSTFVYAVSIMGTDDAGPEYLAPLRPLRAEELEQADQLPWYAEMPAGRHPLLCARLDTVALAGGGAWYEGLWVFTSRRRHSWIEGWLRDLEVSSSGDAPGIPLDQAFALLGSSLEATRGEPLHRLPPDERAALQRTLSAAHLKDLNPWRVADPRVDEFYFPASSGR